MQLIYTATLVCAYGLLRLIALVHRRLRENFRLRRALPDFFVAGKRQHIWFHAASAGEFEQARAIAIEWRKIRKDAFFSFSYFSDSAYRAKRGDKVPDILFALPFDFPWSMNRLVARMKPDALIIAKYDAWPNQVRAAHRAGVPVYLASATLPEKSLRWRWPLRAILKPVYRSFARIFAINANDAKRLRAISPGNVYVAGDTRFDAILERLQGDLSAKPAVRKIRAAFRGRPVLVAGSTYEQSEKMIVEFLSGKPLLKNKAFAAIIAPHHVHAERINRMEQVCQAAGLRATRWSKYSGKACDVLIIDTLGLLPHLYPLASVAYVGGGFRGSVHSVIEPVIAGVPVLTGPQISNSAEALELRQKGLLFVLEHPDATVFASIVENVGKSRSGLKKHLLSYFRQRVGVSRQIVHTVMDDLLQK